MAVPQRDCIDQPWDSQVCSSSRSRPLLMVRMWEENRQSIDGSRTPSNGCVPSQAAGLLTPISKCDHPSLEAISQAVPCDRLLAVSRNSTQTYSPSVVQPVDGIAPISVNVRANDAAWTRPVQSDRCAPQSELVASGAAAGHFWRSLKEAGWLTVQRSASRGRNANRVAIIRSISLSGSFEGPKLGVHEPRLRGVAHLSRRSEASS